MAIRSTRNFEVNLPRGSAGGLYREARWKARPEGSTGGSTEDSIGRLERGGSTGGSMEGSTGELVWGARLGGSTEGARYISTCTTMKPPVTATYPRDSHGLRPGNHGQRSCGTVRTSFLA